MTTKKRNKNASHIPRRHPLMPREYTPVFIELNDGNEGLVLKNCHDLIIPIEEMREVAEKILKTVSELSNEIIETHNRKVRKNYE